MTERPTVYAIELPGDDPLILEATDWLVRLRDEDAAPELLAQWERWLDADTRHRSAFARVQELWEAVGDIEPLPWPTDAEVMCDRYQAKEPIAVWRGASVHSLHRSRRRVIAGIAAAASLAAVLVVAAVVAERSRWPDVLETATAENDTFSLRDGSTVALGGASRVRVSMAPERRSLVLERGEAFFEVARDAKRPFTVRAGDAEITAIGTAFNVRRSADRVLVAVTHGVVKITPTHGDTGSRESLLRAGQQTVLSPVAWSAPAPAEIAVVVAWRNGRLRYESEPLRYVVADVARYSKVPVEITDPDVGSIPVTTTVLERDLQGWLQGLEQALPVEVEFGEERITISRKRAAAGPGE